MAKSINSIKGKNPDNFKFYSFKGRYMIDESRKATKTTSWLMHWADLALDGDGIPFKNRYGPSY